MKKFLVLLVVASCLLFGCKKSDQVDNNAVDSGVVETPTVTQSAEAEPLLSQAKKDQVVTLENPRFKPTATVKSIVLKKAN